MMFTEAIAVGYQESDDEEGSMKLQCSAGHQWDSEKASDRWWRRDKKPGDRCGMELSYDRMSGTRRCRKVLRKVSPPTDHE